MVLPPYTLPTMHQCFANFVQQHDKLKHAVKVLTQNVSPLCPTMQQTTGYTQKITDPKKQTLSDLITCTFSTYINYIPFMSKLH